MRRWRRRSCSWSASHPRGPTDIRSSSGSSRGAAGWSSASGREKHGGLEALFVPDRVIGTVTGLLRSVAGRRPDRVRSARRERGVNHHAPSLACATSARNRRRPSPCDPGSRPGAPPCTSPVVIWKRSRPGGARLGRHPVGVPVPPHRRRASSPSASSLAAPPRDAARPNGIASSPEPVGHHYQIHCRSSVICLKCRQEAGMGTRAARAPRSS